MNLDNVPHVYYLYISGISFLLQLHKTQQILNYGLFRDFKALREMFTSTAQPLAPPLTSDTQREWNELVGASKEEQICILTKKQELLIAK